MDNNYLTAGDLALMRTEGRGGYGCYGDGYGYGCHRRNGMAATGIGLSAGLGGGALLLAAAGLWGLNQASKARARGNESAILQMNKTQEVLAGVISREAVRQDGVNIDVQQTLRSQAYTSAYGGGANANANALAQAEALALLQNNNNNNSINSAIGGCNFLRVARYSAPQPCPCDSCNG